jgi:tetratricopeptide (TPR) repeat protein
MGAVERTGRILITMFMDNAQYRLYEHLLVELAQLMANGEGAGNRACDFREIMAVLEEELSQDEIGRLKLLSSDLYMLEEDEIFDDPDPRQSNPRWLPMELKKAYDDSDWLEMLRLLRLEAPEISTRNRAYLRARAYDSIGHTYAAFAFMDYLTRNEPDNITFHYFRLYYLMASDINRAIAEANAIIDNPSAFSPLVIQAAGILIDNIEPAKQRETFDRLIQALDRVFRDVQTLKHLDAQMIAFAYVILGYALEGVALSERAQFAFKLAVGFDPDNSDYRQALQEHIEKHGDSKKSSSDKLPILPTPEDIVFDENFQEKEPKRVWEELLAA